MSPHTGIGSLQERAGAWQHRTLVYSVTICKMSKKKKKKKPSPKSISLDKEQFIQVYKYLNVLIVMCNIKVNAINYLFSNY